MERSKYKIVILAMSCNKNDYYEEEKAVRETWGKDILDSKVANVSLFFYRGGSNGYSLDKEEHVIHVPGSDEINGTFMKTIRTFSQFSNIDYDFIVRINCSTYVNLHNLITFMNRLSNEDFNTPFCCRLLWSSRTFFRGFAFIMSKQLVTNIILNKNMAISGVDDVAIGQVFRKLYKGKNILPEIAKYVPSVNIHTEYKNDVNKKVFIRIKGPKFSGKDVSKRMREVHDIYTAFDEESFSVEVPKKFEEIEIGPNKTIKI